MTKVFIDGSAGTTGLRIHERLADRKELEILSLPPELRKDRAAREEILNAADVAFLCLGVCRFLVDGLWFGLCGLRNWLLWGGLDQQLLGHR